MKGALLAMTLALGATGWTQPCRGQEIGPAIDPGVAGSVASMDVLRRSEERRARGLRRHGTSSRSRTAQTCANARAMRSRHRGDPRFAELLQLCAQGGY